MRIGVIGSRTVDESVVHTFLLEVWNPAAEGVSTNCTTFLAGGALGVDTAVRDYARGAGLDFVMFKPYHLLDRTEGFNAKFFYTRNRQILDNSDEVLIFWDGEEDEVQAAIHYCDRKGKEYHVEVV